MNLQDDKSAADSEDRKGAQAPVRKTYAPIQIGNGTQMLPIKDCKGFPRFSGSLGIYVIERGEATICSGAMAIAWPGTKIIANSGSVVVAYNHQGPQACPHHLRQGGVSRASTGCSGMK